MATITKIDITENLIEKYQLPKNEAKKVVENFFEEVRISLESGQDLVTLNYVIKLHVQDVILKLEM